MISSQFSKKDNVQSHPNIILITIDCWRGDHFSGIDDTKVQTPHLDRLSSEGTAFSNAHTCGGWTRPAMTSIIFINICVNVWWFYPQ